MSIYKRKKTEEEKTAQRTSLEKAAQCKKLLLAANHGVGGRPQITKVTLAITSPGV